MPTTLLIYGAGGYTGNQVFCALREVLEAIPYGRRGAAESGIAALDLHDAGAVRAALAGHTAVLNCAGPFAHTWRPLVEACVETGAHYLDITGEWEVFEGMREWDERARERGVMLLPGVGFDVVATDCLAAHVARRLPDASRLQIGLSALELVSRGSARTIMASAGQKVRVRRGGQLVEEPRLRETSFDFGHGPKAAHAVSWGDVSTAFRTTGIPDIEVFFEATPLVMGMGFANRTFGWMMKSPLWQRLARVQAELVPSGPAPHVRAGLQTVAVARATNDAGRRAESRLVTPEAYTFTVTTAVEIAKRVLAGESRAGFQTPASLLGPDFVLGFAGVTRDDLA